MGSSFLPVQQLALSRVGIEEIVFVPYSYHSCIWLWFRPSATILCPHLLRFCAASGGARECLPVCVWHGAISAPGLSLEGMPSPKHLRHPKSSARRMEVSVCKFVCYVGLAACHLSPRALAALKRCHHRIAGNRCPGTSSWLCPSKQTAISSKSSEVSPLVFD